MLPNPESDADHEVVGENIRAVQAIYFAQQLEDMRMRGLSVGSTPRISANDPR